MGVAYNPKIVTSGLTLYLDFGNTKSYSGSGNDIIDLTSSIYASSQNTVTIANGSATFYGNVGYNASIQVAHSTNYMSSLSTASCWVRSNTASFNAAGCFMSKRPYIVFGPNLGNNTQLAVYYYLDNTYKTPGGIVAASNVRQWHQYTMSWDGTFIRLYTDGVLIGQSANLYGNVLSTAATSNVNIGKDDTLSRYFDGQIALPMMYNRALSQDEIKQNFNATRGRFGV